MPTQRKRFGKGDRGMYSRDNAPARNRENPLSPGDVVDEHNMALLRNFVTEHGKILPPRLTGVTAAQQRQIKRGVRRARNMGLMA